MSTKAQERRMLHGTGKEYWRRLWSEIKRDKWLYLLLLPGLIYFIVFKYLLPVDPPQHDMIDVRSAFCSRFSRHVYHPTR